MAKNERRKTICIVHYNTPELTEALVKSIRKVGCDWPVVIFDNSDSKPFKAKMKGVKVINNTKQQLVNFDKEIEKYKERCNDLSFKGSFVSVKHMMSVQYLMENVLTDAFVLMDSDILITKPFEFIWDEKYAAAGRIVWYKGLRQEKDRLLPFLCYINSKLCNEHGAKFYDPERCFGLQPGGMDNKANWYDTGASLLEDITNTKPQLWCRNWQFLEDCFVHFGAASYRRADINDQQEWLNQYRYLWADEEDSKPKYTVLTYIFGDYELVQEVEHKDPLAEYLLITDNPQLTSNTWTVICDDKLQGPVMEKCYYVRFHPFEYAHTDTVVRIDGSIQMKKPLTQLLQAFDKGKFDRCLMIHPVRNNFAQELDCWVAGRGYKREVADRCLKMMQGFGYKLDYKGMFQGCFEIVRNTPVNHDINNLTFALMKYTGGDEIDRLDQHITTFVIHTQHRDLKVLPVSEHIVTDGRWMQWYYHHSKTKIVSPELADAYMFNKRVKCWDAQ